MLCVSSCPAEELAPAVPALRALEGAIRYPLGEDAFTIDHGPAYAPFFRQLGPTRFVLARAQGAVVGGLACVAKPITCGGSPLAGLYIADLKLAPAWRGRGVVQRMVWELFRAVGLSAWDFAFCAAMQGRGGDVARSFRGLHLGRLLAPRATLQLYFPTPAALAALDPRGCPPPPEPGLALSPERGALWCSTAGRKDLRLVSSGEPWPLVHLPRSPAACPDGYGAYLRRAGRALLDAGQAASACFALDRRLRFHHDWLAGRGLAPSAECVVHGLRHPFARRALRRRWVHLATSEI